MSVAAKKAWETRRKLYGEKGLRAKAEQVEKSREEPKKGPEKKGHSKKSRKASESEQPTEPQTTE